MGRVKPATHTVKVCRAGMGKSYEAYPCRLTRDHIVLVPPGGNGQRFGRALGYEVERGRSALVAYVVPSTLKPIDPGDP